MRTTINVREDLLRRAKKFAAQRSSTLNQVVENALTDLFSRTDKGEPISPVQLPVSKQSGGVQPGIDLDDTAALLDAIEDKK